MERRLRASVLEWRGEWFCVVGEEEVRAVSISRGSEEAALREAEVKYGIEISGVSREGEFVEELRSYLEEGEPLESGAEPRGTDFQEAVWSAAKIPFGETRTYGEMAEAIGRSGSARAVGNALGANPAPLFVPCHRVVSKGGLGGFSRGRELKRRLLEMGGVRVPEENR